MKVLITGGAGFIGSHLAEDLLADGHEVAAIDDLSTGSLDNIAALHDNSHFRLTIGSVLDAEAMEPLVAWADHIYHLAAVVGVQKVVESPATTLEINLKGTEVVLSLAHRHGKKVLLASTSEVYGRHPVNKPLKETDQRIYGPTTVGRWSYAESKAIDEFLALAYHRERGLDVVIVRFFNTVGPRQTGRYGMVIPRFVSSALKGDPIPVYGDGTQSRSFTYVGDAVWAVRALMERTPSASGEVFNVGNGEEVTILGLAEKVKALTDSGSEVRLIPFEEVFGKGFEDMEFRTPDISKLTGATGYRPTVNLDEILERVVAFYRQAQNAMSPVSVGG